MKKANKTEKLQCALELIKKHNIPSELANIFELYYDAFLARGFTSEQSFRLLLEVAKFYLHRVE